MARLWRILEPVGGWPAIGYADRHVRLCSRVREFLHGRGEPTPVREEANLFQCAALRLGYFPNGASAPGDSIHSFCLNYHHNIFPTLLGPCRPLNQLPNLVASPFKKSFEVV